MQERTGGLASALAVVWVLSLAPFGAAAEGPDDWHLEFPLTDYQRHSIDFAEIRFDGATRDSIPPIDDPRFRPAQEVRNVGSLEPVLSLSINDEARAYPLRLLLWHEIVNDLVGGVPVLVSYCPLCNSGVVFDRRLGERVLRFGNTGRLRHFDMVMYDHQTESWWQQFLGEALIGELTGARLKVLPSRLESLARFRARAPDGLLLVPSDPQLRPYGATPYVGMDDARVSPARYPYALPPGVRPLSRVVVVGKRAWTLDLLRDKRRIEDDGLVITRAPGQNSIHDTSFITAGRDVGNVVVQRRAPGGLEDVPYDVSFAFAFAAFRPEGRLRYD
jgi:hypothetical protein